MKAARSGLLFFAALFMLCGGLLLTTNNAVAQTLTSGDIVGTITDPAGAVIPGATLTAKNQDTGATVTTKSTAQGNYRFNSLPPGRYNISATASGFAAVTRQVVVSIGGTSSANLQLGVNANQTTVEVTAETPVVSLTPGNQTTMDRIQVEQMPNGGQDLTQVAQVSPGAKMNTQGGYGNFEVNGLPGTSNNFTVNGGPENDPYLNLNNSGASNLLLGTNDIQEVTIVTNGYSGQYGHFAGAQYNATTVSGTNKFHGNAKYWWSGSVLNAKDYFNSGPGSVKPRENLNQWAARLNGPIVKDKTFFAVDYEGYRVVLPTANQTYIPTTAYESAVLANLATNGMSASVPFYQNMFNLYNGAPGAGNAAAVAASEDPALGCGDIVAQDPATGLYSSNLPGIIVDPATGAVSSSTPCARKFTSTVGNFTPEWNLGARIDQHFGDNDTAFIHFRTDHGVQPTFTDPINPVFNATSVQPDYEGQLSETHVFGPNAVNQAILTGSWYSAIFRSVNQAAATKAFPANLFFGDGLFTALGGENYVFPQGRNVTQIGLTDDFSWTHGRHTIKFGGNYATNYVTDAGFGVLAVTPYAESDSMTDFSSGIMDIAEQRFPTRNEQRFRLWNLGLYIQDDFQATNNLKLTLTLRTEHNGNPICFTNCFARLTGPFASVQKGGDVPYNSVIQSTLRDAFPSVQRILWAPRFGFTYNPWTNTVLSGGFGIFYDAPPATVISRFNRNSPQVNQFVDQNFADPFAPQQPGNIFDIMTGSQAAFASAYAAGGTYNSISTSLPTFSAPAYSTIAGTALTPRYQEWNLKVQQAIGTKSALTLNYVGNHGIRIPIVNGGYNAYCRTGRCSGAAAGIFPSASPDPMFKTISETTFAGTSNYNGLNASFQHRFDAGFTGSINYTWSHALDMVSNGGLLPFGDNSITSQINPLCLRCNNYGNADYDIRHYVSASFVWNTKALSYPVLGAITGGWTFSGNVFWRTGVPYTVTTSLASSITNYGGTIEGTLLTPGVQNTSCGNPNKPCLSASDFAAPTRPISSFGNMERNQFRGPHFFDTDFAVMKNFHVPISESSRLSLGVQAFNIFNHPNFDIPVHSLNSGNFGTIQSTVSVPTSVFGSFVGAAASGRILELHGEISF